MSIGRILLGIGALVLGLAAIALAHDIHAWDGGIDRGDALFASKPAAARWSASTWLPRDPALTALEIKDDLAVRSGEKAFAVAVATPTGYDEGRQKAKLRGLAELAVSDVLSTGSGAQASRAGNLLGILAATDESEADASVTDRRAAETFEAAVRADRSNDDAKYNLELLLRRSKVVGSREGAGGSSGDFGESLPGAGAGLPGSGY